LLHHSVRDIGKPHATGQNGLLTVKGGYASLITCAGHGGRATCFAGAALRFHLFWAQGYAVFLAALVGDGLRGIKRQAYGGFCLSGGIACGIRVCRVIGQLADIRGEPGFPVLPLSAIELAKEF